MISGMRANTSIWEVDYWHELCYNNRTEFRNGMRSRQPALTPALAVGGVSNLTIRLSRSVRDRLTGAGSRIRFGHPHPHTMHQIVSESLITLAATGEVADRQAQLTPFFLSQVAGRVDLDHGDRDSKRGSRTPPLYSLSNA
jgi:hypothetical protein